MRAAQQGAPGGREGSNCQGNEPSRRAEHSFRRQVWHFHLEDRPERPSNRREGGPSTPWVGVPPRGTPARGIQAYFSTSINTCSFPQISAIFC